MSSAFVTHYIPTIQQRPRLWLQSHLSRPSSSPIASRGPTDSFPHTTTGQQTVQMSQRAAGRKDLAVKRNAPASVGIGKEQFCPRILPSGTETSSPAHVSLCFSSVDLVAVLQLYPNTVNHISLRRTTPRFPARRPGLMLKATTSYRLQTKQSFFYTAHSLDP